MCFLVYLDEREQLTRLEKVDKLTWMLKHPLPTLQRRQGDSHLASPDRTKANQMKLSRNFLINGDTWGGNLGPKIVRGRAPPQPNKSSWKQRASGVPSFQSPLLSSIRVTISPSFSLFPRVQRNVFLSLNFLPLIFFYWYEVYKSWRAPSYRGKAMLVPCSLPSSSSGWDIGM